MDAHVATDDPKEIEGKEKRRLDRPQRRARRPPNAGTLALAGFKFTNLEQSSVSIRVHYHSHPNK